MRGKGPSIQISLQHIRKRQMRPPSSPGSVRFSRETSFPNAASRQKKDAKRCREIPRMFNAAAEKNEGVMHQSMTP